MSHVPSLAELRKMKADDLLKEVQEQRLAVTRVGLQVRLGKEKGSHLYQQAKKQLAQMLTVLAELQMSTPSHE